MDGADAAALSERDEGGRIPVVVAPNLFGVEWGHGLTDYASIHFIGAPSSPVSGVVRVAGWW